MSDICRLTGKSGRYVDSHLIPKALTRPEASGLSFIEAGRGRQPIRRHSSWYDNRLVTDQGEKLLAEIDDWAIKKLRQHHLVWSGWGPNASPPDVNIIPGTDWGIRNLTDKEWPKLRLFFLSILWRAAASSRREFDEVKLPIDNLDVLREMVLSGNTDPNTLYPVQLIQLSTIGKIHNQTPFNDTKTIPAVAGMPEHRVPIIRFYFDGLISHFDMRSEKEIQDAGLRKLFVGFEEELTVTTVTYERSFQRENLEAIMAEADKKSVRR